METVKILHEWTVEISKEIDETTTETRDGQSVTITRKVTKPVTTKMALKHPSRRELRQAELFYGKEFNKFITLGFLPRSIMVNKHLDVSGGVLSEKERLKLAELAEKRANLEADLVRATNETEDVKKGIRAQLVAVTTQTQDLSNANENIFSQTADTKAQNQLVSWFQFNLTLIDRSGAWKPYFEGDNFEAKEEFMWKLEEANDEFFLAAVEKIALYTGLFAQGVSTKEQFQLIEEELKKQLEARKAKQEEAAKPAVDSVAVPEVVP